MTTEKENNIFHSEQAYLSEIISGSPIPTFVIDKSHTVTHFNNACETLTGIAAADIIGTTDQWRAFYKSKRPVMADFILDGASDHNIEAYYKGRYRPSKVKDGAYEAEDFFPDLGEDGKWLFFTAVPLKDLSGNVVGAIETLQDITKSKKTSELNRAMLRISKSLHEFTYLEDLLGYISKEIKGLLGSEGAIVILHDASEDKLYFQGVAYDNPDTERRVSQIRFSPDEIVAGKVIRTGDPIIMNDATTFDKFRERDRRLGYNTRSLVQVPVRAEDRIIGVLSGINKIGGRFTDKDVELLTTLAGTVALAIENIRFSEELRQLYREVRELNHAKDKTINHLSHELKTPIAILSDAVSMLEDEMEPLPEEDWKPFTDMIHRNLRRITDVQEEVADIMKDGAFKKAGLIIQLFEECRDELVLMAMRNASASEKTTDLRRLIDERYLLSGGESIQIDLGQFVKEQVEIAKEAAAKRIIEFRTHLDTECIVTLPGQVLQKITSGLLRNAIENTPDQGRIEVNVYMEAGQPVLKLADRGVGIREEYHQRIFEGFIPVQEQNIYSTGTPYTFNAGGRGADLLRIKVFSERYRFSLRLESSRCRFLSEPDLTCPGNISMCNDCRSLNDCFDSGGTTLTLLF